MKYNILFLFNIILFSMVFDFGQSVDLPDFIHVCKRNDPNIVNCVTESVEFLKPYLQKGVPEYNIPSLEPLSLNNLIASDKGNIKISAKEVKAYGASDFTITDLQVNFDELVFGLEIKLPHLYITGIYDIDGKVLLLPIKGNGDMIGNFTQCTGSVRIHAGTKPRPDGGNNVYVKDFMMKITVGKGILNLDNLFGGDKTLSEVINKAINSNFDLFLAELQPAVEKVLSDAFREIANSIVSQFSYEQLFPLD